MAKPDNRRFAIRHFPPAALREALRKMYLIRRFEEGAEESYARRLIHGTMDLSIGQEASAVAGCIGLEPGDKIASTHRGHGHCIAKGADVGRMFAEFFGKQTGYCRGRGGSMHIADVKTGNLGANGIVGGGLPIAVAAALSAKRPGRPDVTLCFFGDGAKNEGAFHEALNIASVWRLLVVFVCGNNGCGMSTSTERSTAVKFIAERAAAYAMPGVTVDGHDFSAVAEALHHALARARTGEGPSLVETLTYRWRGHSKSDRNRYRSRQEIDAWIARDPIVRFRADLIGHGVIDEAGVAVGAALTGLKPVFELQFSDFATLAMEQIVNQAAKLRYMLGGEASVPVVFRMPAGSGTGAAARHSQSLEAWFGHVPGPTVLQPATPGDAKGMLLAAIEDPDPVLIFEHKLLYKTRGPVPEGHYLTPIGKAAIRREGTDLTIVAGAIMVHRALQAAEALAADGIEAEVINLRSIRPIDHATILGSVRRTGRLMVVYEGVKSYGIGAEISAMVAESDAFDFLDAPILRLGGAEAPIPYNPDLERAAVPQAEAIEAAARRLVRGEV